MYTLERLPVEKVVAADIQDLSSTAVHTTSYSVLEQCTVRRVLALVTTLMNGPATVQFKKRPTFGSAVGESVVATLVIPDTTVVGKVLFKNFNPVTLEPGDQLVMEVTVAATAGAAHYGVKLDLHSEDAKELADMVLSS